jgi:hypothetical protein
MMNLNFETEGKLRQFFDAVCFPCAARRYRVYD